MTAITGTRVVDRGESLSRGRFLRRAGAFGLAVAAIGDLISAPVTDARGGPVRRDVVPGEKIPDDCTGTLTCTRCNACCGSPCKPYGVNYCYHCISDNCGSSYYACYEYKPDSFVICCT
jgi:hypothetical protein